MALEASTRLCFRKESVCLNADGYITTDQPKISNSLSFKISSLTTHNAALFIAQRFDMQIYQSKTTMSLALEVSHFILNICDGFLQSIYEGCFRILSLVLKLPLS